MATDVELTVELGKLMPWEDVDEDFDDDNNYVIDNDKFAITMIMHDCGWKQVYV